ncbi:hypothetical protein HELRODRAFT_180361 [Helobdella robusta]|uniref:Uncharacterized protein n=1 Tax=Helobdella robusta TaxID=6412 RepID=T1FFT9_HELRO|nr:hypothetical protein HELRODRAFT_180361 [Helobdella robusta]ESN93952.1 hypothetical protein HELRODRAFT_180361 [Helobdella robusta]
MEKCTTVYVPVSLKPLKKHPVQSAELEFFLLGLRLGICFLPFNRTTSTPVFTGPVCQSVGFRTTLACFHWAVESDRLSHDQGPVFTGPVSQSVGFRSTLACFHWAVESDRLSHDQHKTTRVRTTLETNCVTLVRVRNYANEHRVSYQIHF